MKEANELIISLMSLLQHHREDVCVPNCDVCILAVDLHKYCMACVMDVNYNGAMEIKKRGTIAISYCNGFRAMTIAKSIDIQHGKKPLFFSYPFFIPCYI